MWLTSRVFILASTEDASSYLARRSQEGDRVFPWDIRKQGTVGSRTPLIGDEWPDGLSTADAILEIRQHTVLHGARHEGITRSVTYVLGRALVIFGFATVDEPWPWAMTVPLVQNETVLICLDRRPGTHSHSQYRAAGCVVPVSDAVLGGRVLQHKDKLEAGPPGGEVVRLMGSTTRCPLPARGATDQRFLQLNIELYGRGVLSRQNSRSRQHSRYSARGAVGRINVGDADATRPCRDEGRRPRRRVVHHFDVLHGDRLGHSRRRRYRHNTPYTDPRNIGGVERIDVGAVNYAERIAGTEYVANPRLMCGRRLV